MEKEVAAGGWTVERVPLLESWVPRYSTPVPPPLIHPRMMAVQDWGHRRS